ncbi:MAG: hypothetical protein ABIP94_00335 [Planctomycetota bacterium]
MGSDAGPARAAACAGRAALMVGMEDSLPPSPAVRRRAAVALLLPLVLSSCFTMALWGFSPDTEPNPRTGEEESVFAYDEETKWSWKLFFVRVLVTPLSVGLDCLTCPVQAVIWGWNHDDEDESQGERHRYR